MSIATAIQNAQAKVAAAYTKCNAKGATMPLTQDLDHLDDCIESIPTGSSPNLTTLPVTPTTSTQVITPTPPVDGYNEVDVAAVTSAIDSNIQAGNIKKDVAILGVTGTYEGSGGGNPEAEENDVIFIDYDGTIRYSYSAADFANLTALPANPSHTGLTAQGWNWTLADAKTYVAAYGMLVIGQNYVTDDGKTRLYITVQNVNHLRRICWSQSAANGVTINWGDGTTAETVSGTGVKTLEHTYASAGTYVITLNCTSGTYGLGGGADTTRIFGDTRSSANQYKYCMRSLFKVELGTGCAMNGYVFNGALSLTTITVPKSIIKTEYDTFRNCKSLKAFVLGSDTGSCYISGGTFRDASSIRYVSAPKHCDMFGYSGFHYYYTNIQKLSISPSSINTGQSSMYGIPLLRLILPEGVTTLGTASIMDSSYLEEIIIPSTVTTLGSQCLRRIPCLTRVIMKATIPPSLNDTTFQDSSSELKIWVPYSADHSVLTAYKGASNWSAYESQIYELDENGNIPSA